MGNRFHIIITGEDGRSSAFQFSRRKLFITAGVCITVLVIACVLTITAGDSLFDNQHLSRQVDQLESKLAQNEQTASLYQTQITQLEKTKLNQIEALKKEYEFKLNNQKARYDLENTNLQLENVKLMNTAINDLNARSELIESVMHNIGVEIIKSAPESPENSGGPFIPANDPPYEDLMKRVDSYLRTIKFMPLGRPINGSISSKYGKRTDPVNKKKGIHEGVDIRGKRGDKIRATAAGVVVKAFKNGGYGNYVEIDHGNGYRTVYAHMQNYLVKRGEAIEQGQVIGQIGSSGRSTGPHLHYEIRLNKKPVNPTKFMKVADLSHELLGGSIANVQK